MPLLGTFLRMSLPDDFDDSDDALSQPSPVQKLAVKVVNVPTDNEQALSMGLAIMLRDERQKMVEKHRGYIERARWSAIAGGE